MEILIIDDDAGLAKALAKALAELGHHASLASTAAAGLLAAKTKPPELVLLDINMPEITGLEVLPQLRQLNPGLAVVMITGEASHQSAVQAIKLGAEDYLAKPFEMDELRLILERVTARGLLQKKLEQSKQRRIEDYGREYLFSSDPAMKRIYADLETVARRDQVTVLVQGETGTGKEHAARLLHLYSERSLGPFIELNCAALPESLMESELFGYEPGAFTGAQGRKQGLFELAQGGTLFLDEIGELPPRVQVKLLKVLEERVCRRLGGLENIKLDVRLVTATNRDLAQEVAQGRFRADLYYRLNAFSVTLPPLRSRQGDLGKLAAFFFQRACQSYGHPMQAFGPEFLEALEEHSWPGNIRELKNVIERLVISSGGKELSLDDLRAALPREQADSGSGPVNLDAEALRGALERADGDKSKAAKQLGVSRPTLYRYLKRFGIAV